jgi:hypothetical protein
MTLDQVVSASSIDPTLWATTPVVTPPIPVVVNTNPVNTTPIVSSVLQEKTWYKNQEFGSYNTNLPQRGLVERITIDIAKATLWTTIFLVIWFVFFGLAQVNIWSDEKNIDYSDTVLSYKNFVNEIDTLIWYPWLSTYRNLIWSITNDNINSIVHSTLPFIFKKDILEEVVGTIVSSILTKSQTLQDINKDINKYGFIHPEIMSLLENTKEQIPIMVSLHTLETIKFWTALKIFSMLDTFLQQTSQKLSISKESLSEVMTTYTERWEKDIANYLSMCYLNPYEKLPDCNQINDFNNYFTYEDKDIVFDTKLFSNIVSLVDAKLEKSDVASLQIEFNRFDPNVKNIGFRVTVNTLAEDDAAFMARWILNPHIFIISTLVTLLKQSFFVIGDSISIDKLNIKQQNISIWNIQIPINTSFMIFDLPLQNSSEREIFDFYNNR